MRMGMKVHVRKSNAQSQEQSSYLTSCKGSDLPRPQHCPHLLLVSPTTVRVSESPEYQSPCRALPLSYLYFMPV
ncbi:hypothetical protein EYF80_023575 [Liparis tanakae]|uniref:Uncharacterized protein n=1 Tax=Liparis tanakae TaxID=230148 RepID=A0A4Z2HKE9_9TELE|nr:hypothetical protein EYF80_023575 [Liparis tanakae]